MTENELRETVCDKARSWLGRKEADGSHREIIDVYNSIPIPGGYRMTYSDPWCAAYVSAVGYACGLSDIIYPDCGCDSMIRQYQQHGRWQESDAYRPQPGDVIFYDWQDSGAGDNRGGSDHVGLVLSTTGSTISVIEGNTSDMVAIRTRTVDQMYIRGYGLPDYASKASAINGHEDPEDEPAIVPVPDVSGPDTQEAVTLPALPSGQCYVALPVLRFGCDSEAVRAAQLLLKGRGFSVGWMGADGDFGPKTEAALGKFKISRDLPRSPEIDAETWQKLICE